MKKVVIFFFMIIITCSLFAQLPWTTHSFRFRSTSGIFNDDLDIILDPGDIPSVEGSRLWTNLSNIVSGLEDIEGGNGPKYVTDNKYAIGQKTEFFGFHDAFLFHNIGVRNGNTVDTFSSQYLYDPIGGILTRIDENNKYKDQYDTSGTDYYFGLARKFGEKKIGIGVWHRGRVITQLPYNDVHTQNFYRYDGNSPVLTSSFASERLNELKENRKTTDFMLSFWMPVGSMDMAIRGLYGNYTIDNDSLQTSYSYLNRAPNQTIISRADTSTWSEENINLKGTRFGVELEQRFGNNERGYWQFKETYRHSSANDHNGLLTDSFTSIDEITLVPGIMINSLDSLRTGNIDAEEKTDYFSLSSLFSIDIGERARFGLGASLSFNRFSYVKKYQDITFNWNSEYNDGNNLSTSADSTVSATSINSWEEENSRWTRTIRIPVGIEFDFTQSVAIRLGAEHTRSIINNTNRVIDTGSSTEVVRVELGDGSWYEYTNNSTISESNNEVVTYQSNTLYTYGIGYKVNDYLQIDFMGFSDLTDLGTWNLSAMISF